VPPAPPDAGPPEPEPPPGAPPLPAPDPVVTPAPPAPPDAPAPEPPDAPAPDAPPAPPDPGPPPAPEPPVPWPGPDAPLAPAGTAASNENPLLPHTPAAASARGAALLQLIYAAATDPEADPAKALTYIAGMAQAGISDVGRFAPAAMRQAAAEQAAQMAADAAPD